LANLAALEPRFGGIETGFDFDAFSWCEPVSMEPVIGRAWARAVGLKTLWPCIIALAPVDIATFV
jgi:hypothetical protein